MNQLAPIGLIVTAEALEKAVELLATRVPDKSYVEAWHVFTAERDHRKLGLPAQPLILARQRFDELPTDVKAALLGTPRSGN